VAINAFALHLRRGVALGTPLRPAILDRDVLTVYPAELTQSLLKRRDERVQIEGVVAPKKPIVGTLPRCCARAGYGLTTGASAAPPRAKMNSRRFNRSPRRRGRAERLAHRRREYGRSEC
jgi:hypothetical protein